MDLLSATIRASLEAATSRYQEALAESPDCVAYLANRGITVEPELPDEYGNPYRLGIVTEGTAHAEHEHLIGRLAIPYLRRLGPGPIGMKFRDLTGNAKTKYLTHHGMGNHLFNTEALHVDSDVIGICEGELDAIVASEAGIPSVGVPGVTNFRDEWRHAFEGYELVVVFGDGDEPGRGFAQRLADRLPNARPVTMPDGHDVSSLAVSEGTTALRKRAGLGPSQRGTGSADAEGQG